MRDINELNLKLSSIHHLLSMEHDTLDKLADKLDKQHLPIVVASAVAVETAMLILKEAADFMEFKELASKREVKSYVELKVEELQELAKAREKSEAGEVQY